MAFEAACLRSRLPAHLWQMPEASDWLSWRHEEDDSSVDGWDVLALFAVFRASALIEDFARGATGDGEGGVPGEGGVALRSLSLVGGAVDGAGNESRSVAPESAVLPTASFEGRASTWGMVMPVLGLWPFCGR